MKDAIADVFQDFADKIRNLGEIEDMSLETLLLNYWECCLVMTVRTLRKHGTSSDHLLSLLQGVQMEAVSGTLEQKEDAIMQALLRSRITGNSDT